MRFTKILILAFIASPLFSFAQKIELIKSGPLIDSASNLYDSAHYKQSLALLKKVTRSDTNYVRSLYERAISFEADSQYNEAIAACKEALTLKEQREFEPEIYNTYGNTLLDMKEYEQSLKIFDEAMAKYPAYSLLYFNKGIVYLETKKYAQAEEWFKKTLFVNPYMYSAHYQLGLAALQQGKLIPAYISFMGYLLMAPEGRYHGNAIKFLSQISGNADAILEFKNARTEQPGANYQEIEDILAAKAALDKGYKPIISLDDPLSRNIQAVVEKLEYKADDKDFWVQYYVPYFKKVYKDGKFEPFIFHVFSGVDIEPIQTYVKKNKKLLETFEQTAADYFDQIRYTREFYYTRRDTVKLQNMYSDGKLLGLCATANNGKIIVGPWKGYYSAGNKKSVGMYNTAGERTGDWVWYNFDGSLKAKEHYVNGKLDGAQDYYHTNGNLSSHELFVAGKLNGVSTTYHYGGNVKMIAGYKDGKKDGLEKTYYANASISTEATYLNDELSGTLRRYFKNGKVQEVEQYVNGKMEGPYKRYNENGVLITEGQYAKDKAEGPFKYYHPNGKLRQTVVYAGSKENGLHQEFFDNEQLYESYTAKNGKVNGESVNYYKDGKVLCRASYTDGIMASAKYYDKAGKELSASQTRDGLLHVIGYDLNGNKHSYVVYDTKGNIVQNDTIFFASGRVQQVNAFKDGQMDGMSVTYYLNGQKKNETMMSEGKDHGYYVGYYRNGKKQSEGWMQDGEADGEWHYYDERGTLTTRANYVAGELDGYKEEFYPDGKKNTEYKYSRGWLERMMQYNEQGKIISDDDFLKGSGKYVLRYPNGKVMAESYYKNGDFDGVYKNFYFDGSVARVSYYKKGELDSTTTSYYYGGIKSTTGQYKDGKKTGIWKTYEEDGKLQRTMTYVDNDQNGPEELFYPDGKKDFISVYKDDQLQGPIQKYDPQGDLAYQVVYDEGDAKSYTYLGKDGKLVPELAIEVKNGVIKSFFQNGKPSRECSFVDGIKHGEDKLYYANGQLRSIDHMYYSDYNGSSKSYYENGKPKTDYNYVMDNAEGICREYHSNGNLKKEITYQNGLYNGPTKYYDENGKLVRTLTYYFGNLTAATNEK